MSNQTYIAAVAAFRPDGFAILPMVVYAGNEQDAYLTALTAAEKEILPISDGWTYHRVQVAAIENIAHAIEIDPDLAIKEAWSLQERVDRTKAVPHAD